MAFSTYKTYLMKGTGTTPTYSKLVDIKEFPDLGAAPEQIDVTSLSDPMRIYVPGIQDTEALTFTANYTPADYSTLTALDGTETAFAVWLGATTSNGVDTPNGSNGKWAFKGYLSVFKNGGGVNEAQDMTITILPSTVLTFTAS